MQPDGKLVIAGAAFGTVTADAASLVRLLPNGSLDSSFNATGKLILQLGFSSEVYRVAQQPDGKLLVVGVAYPPNGGQSDIAVARINGDGSLDTSFNGSGIAPAGSTSEVAFDIALQPDGMLLIAGFSYGEAAATVIRLRTDGSLDPAVNGSGNRLVTVSGGTFEANSALLQADGAATAQLPAAGRIAGDREPPPLVRASCSSSAAPARAPRCHRRTVSGPRP